MASSDTAKSTRSPRLRGTLVVVALAALGTSLLARTAGIVDPAVTVGAFALLAGLGIALLWRRSSGSAAGSPASEETGDDADGSSVWNAIPSRQYEGRHAESGGIARGEQERALREIRQRADELSEDESRR